MRDLLIVGIFVVFISQAFSRPYVGAYLWAWFAFMNPQRLSWGFAYSLPFSQIIALVTFLSLFISRERKQNVWSAQTVILLLLVIWICITTIFAANPEGAQKELTRYLKIQVFIFITIAVITDKEKLKNLIWVIVLSIGFFSVKGGLFTILTGGSFRVWGPDDSFISGNNEMALAMLITLPLMYYLYLQENKIWIKRALLVSTFLTTAAVLGSQSRGAFLGILCIGVFFWWKSPNKFGPTLIIAAVALLIVLFMPQSWWDRMNTVESYEEDESAMQRINAWTFAWNVANDRFFGGGANMHTRAMYAIYAPNPNWVYDMHSIYFQILGNQGWVGFSLFMLLGISTWLRCAWIVRHSRGDPDKRWATDLGLMLQVSLIGYAAAGAFLSLAYFDYPYYLIAMSVIAGKLIQQPNDGMAPRQMNKRTDRTTK
ncbi:putative O-glycosylation ligase, exosortase A system-associated [Thiospirillum jenense]|uniref:Putative O-glycosylation ligase, exosortase A system-associated n=1 Tax=Thiospirillum jenense TaxID=1653858 RepID=A0A839H6G9_9GAMM|nr:putative O-glycosylation ligase, exosortase A system-associated [Thiospirillum jenense]MBB1125373.1 putative O-glycosylation ligase, exosortase A system-associated [Thiospirillum jenense]